MPSFNYYTKHNYVMVRPDDDDKSNHYVEVFLKSGFTERKLWLGFRSRSMLVPPTPSGNCMLVKMRAISVSAGSGLPGTKWRVLLPDEYVVSWMVFYNASYTGVYTVIDQSGCPIVLSNRPLSIAA